LSSGCRSQINREPGADRGPEGDDHAPGACTSADVEPSHVVTAMYHDQRVHSIIRVSVGRANDGKQIELVAQRIPEKRKWERPQKYISGNRSGQFVGGPSKVSSSIRSSIKSVSETTARFLGRRYSWPPGRHTCVWP